MLRIARDKPDVQLLALFQFDLDIGESFVVLEQLGRLFTRPHSHTPRGFRLLNAVWVYSDADPAGASVFEVLGYLLRHVRC